MEQDLNGRFFQHLLELTLIIKVDTTQQQQLEEMGRQDLVQEINTEHFLQAHCHGEYLMKSFLNQSQLMT